MDNLREFLNNGKEHVKVEMNADDLMAFYENLIQRAMDELGSLVEEARKERMLSKSEVKEIFGVCDTPNKIWSQRCGKLSVKEASSFDIIYHELKLHK